MYHHEYEKLALAYCIVDSLFGLSKARVFKVNGVLLYLCKCRL